MPIEQVDRRYLEAPYYIAPEGKVAEEAFAVIRDAMAQKGKAGIGRVVISRRERIVLIEPLGKGIMATVLRYKYEVRDEESYFEDIPDMTLPAEMLISLRTSSTGKRRILIRPHSRTGMRTLWWSC